MKTRDQHIADENDRRVAWMCADSSGCSEPGTFKRGGSWVCRWHRDNSGAPIPREEQGCRGPDWRDEVMRKWYERLTEEQKDALQRRPGESRRQYAHRMAKIMRRLAMRVSDHLTGRLPYDKHTSVSGEAPPAEDREASLEQARAESETLARAGGSGR